MRGRRLMREGVDERGWGDERGGVMRKRRG